jgi:Rhs element Vgr protein
MIGSDGPIAISISSNGTQLDETIAIVSIAVDKAIARVPTARIVLLDGDMPSQDFPVSNSDDFKPGAEIEIKAGYGENTAAAIFKGIVVKHSLEITANNTSQLEVTCQDKAIGMTIGRKNANYVDRKDSDVIQQLIGNYSGLSADVASTGTQHKELVQYYCTDWDFMLSRAEVNGLLVMADDGQVTVQPPQVSAQAVLTITYGEDLMEFQADIDARSQLASVKGTSWDLKNQAVVEAQASPPALNQQGDLDSAELARVIGLETLRLQTAAPTDKSALQDWANAQQQKAGLARIRGRMKFQGSAAAKTGCLIELKGAGNRFNGNVFVSRVCHEIANGNWLTEVEFGLSPRWFAERRDLVAPPTSGLLPGAGGLQVGVVKQLDQDPEGHYRVQVTVPVLEAESEGVWARLAKFYASKGIGAFFVPEIGDEVVLGYFNSDPSHPVILGSLYSSMRQPPETPTADNFIKAIVTRSELKLQFDDDKKIVTIITPADNKIIVSDDGKSILLQDQNSNKVELSTSGIALDSPKDISITAQGKVTIDATGQISLSSKADVKVAGLNINNDANVGFVAKGSASAELSASGQTTVKGAMVMIN